MEHLWLAQRTRGLWDSLAIKAHTVTPGNDKTYVRGFIIFGSADSEFLNDAAVSECLLLRTADLNDLEKKGYWKISAKYLCRKAV